jgi:hypothetical protein
VAADYWAYIAGAGTAIAASAVAGGFTLKATSRQSDAETARQRASFLQEQRVTAYRDFVQAMEVFSKAVQGSIAPSLPELEQAIQEVSSAYSRIFVVAPKKVVTAALLVFSSAGNLYALNMKRLTDPDPMSYIMSEGDPRVPGANAVIPIHNRNPSPAERHEFLRRSGKQELLTSTELLQIFSMASAAFNIAMRESMDVEPFDF